MDKLEDQEVLRRANENVWKIWKVIDRRKKKSVGHMTRHNNYMATLIQVRMNRNQFMRHLVEEVGAESCEEISSEDSKVVNVNSRIENNEQDKTDLFIYLINGLMSPEDCEV